MLEMTTCRRLLLLLITGSVIGSILSYPDTHQDSKEPLLTHNSDTPSYIPGDKEVPGVEPLSSTISKDAISSTKIGGEAFNLPGEKNADSKKGIIKSEAGALTPSGKGNNESESRIPLVPSSPRIAEKVNSKNTTENFETGARSLSGNDVAMMVDKKLNTENTFHGNNITDLSDVSMDYDYKDIEGGEYLANPNSSHMHLGIPPVLVSQISEKETTCIYGNKTFTPGMAIERNCEDRCICGKDGSLVNCQPLCEAPFIRAGRGIQDSLCQEKLIPERPCCATLICAEDSEPEPEELCYLGNKTVSRGETVEEGCSRVCLCEAQGMLKCRPRCPQSNATSTGMEAASANQRDKCVPVKDPMDACCTITLCDVTLGDLDQFKPEFTNAEIRVNLTKVEVFNATAIKLTFSSNIIPEHTVVELSTDNLLWRVEKVDGDGIIGNLEPSRTYYVRMSEEAGNQPRAAMYVTLPSKLSEGPNAAATTVPSVIMSGSNATSNIEGCNHRGNSYKVGAEWYDECISFCTCSLVGNKPKTECATIECPTDFGLDVLDPNCLDWEWVPADFVPKPPKCCSQEVRCRNNGSCTYKGKSYNNWSEIPSNVTGCEKRCYCDLGNVSCHSACPPVPALPPPNLQCPPSHAALKHLPEDECCLHWVCGDPSTASLPANSGGNGTPPYLGPLATDSMNHLQLLIDDKKISPGSTSGSSKIKDWTAGDQGFTERYVTPPRRKYHESSDLHYSNQSDLTDDDHGQIHYPMDPGFPTHTETTGTISTSPQPPPYQGPYNPNFKPTQPSIEDVFRLTTRTHPKINSQKSKMESKKPIEPGKPAIKEILTERPPNISHFVPTIAPYRNKLPDSLLSGQQQFQKNYSSSSMNQPALENSYEIISSQDGGENILPQFQFHHEFEDSVPVPGPAQYGDSHQNNNLGTREPAIPSNRGQDPRPPNKIYPGNSRPHINPAENQPIQGHDLPEELYHLINLQHPGVIGLNENHPEGNQGIYGPLHRGEEGEGLRHPGPPPPPYFNPHQIFGAAGENYGGDRNGYQIHPGHRVPVGARQQIEDLLLRVREKDPNAGPFQQYPSNYGQDSDNRKNPIFGPPRVILPNAPQNTGDLTRLNHPFAGTGISNHDIHPLPGPEHGLPPRFPGIHETDQFPDQVTVETLEAISENRVRLVFTVSQVLVGLQGRVEVRYTSDQSNLNPATWKSQIFAPPDDFLATPQLEFELGDLVPSTEYKVMVTVKLQDISNNPTSKIFKVKTLDAPITEATTLPPQIPTDAELTVAEVNSTWANLVWKKFTEYELQFIDGVQLRYKETEGKVYAATPLIHRAVTSYVIENLKPAVTYQVGIYFIPFPGQMTELVSEKPLNFTTSAEPDPYSFDIKVEIKGIKSTEVEVAWRGVPYPEDKYVNIYRAIYQSDTGKEDTSTFKIAKRDSPARTLIGELKPGTRYRLWIEVYLTNGRIKKSNVQDFVTKPGVPSAGSVLQQGKLASQVPLHEGDYYGPLVIVAIVASLAILSTLILLMMLMKRRSSSKADISPRKTTSAYDNPSYKTCEDPATTMTTEISCIRNGDTKLRSSDDDHHQNPKEPA